MRANIARYQTAPESLRKTELKPVTGVEVPALGATGSVPPTAPLSPATTGTATGGTSTFVSSMPPVQKEVLAGAAAAVVGLLLILRRRR